MSGNILECRYIHRFLCCLLHNYILIWKSNCNNKKGWVVIIGWGRYFALLASQKKNVLASTWIHLHYHTQLKGNLMLRLRGSTIISSDKIVAEFEGNKNRGSNLKNSLCNTFASICMELVLDNVLQCAMAHSLMTSNATQNLAITILNAHHLLPRSFLS